MLIRRIRGNEQEELSRLCRSDARWPKYFFGHDLWLVKALNDVNSQDRVVFGAFEIGHGEGDISTYRLVACLFLKLSRFERSRSIEFKNLILPTNEIELDSKISKIAKQLIEKAIRFCEVRGIQKIEIEMPQEEHSIIAIFLSLYFKVVALRERYSPGNLVCILERSIGNSYHGDPFDKVRLAYWLLRCYLPCEILNKEEDGNFVKISFEGRSLSKMFSSENIIGNGKRLRGVMWIFEGTPNEKDINTLIKPSCEQPMITMLLTDYLSDEFKLLLTEKGITFFDSLEVQEIAGGKTSSLSIPIEYQNLGGVITVLEYEQIVEYSKMNNLTYYLLSSPHYGLALCDEQPLVLAVYCSNWKNEGPGIIGCCQINEIRRPKFSELLTQTLPENSALSKEDLNFYRTYSEDELIAQLYCTQLSLFPHPLSIENGTWISDEDIRRYLDGEIIQKQCNLAYLDSDSSENLRSLIIPGISQSNCKRFKVGLSFPGEERDFIKEVADILIQELGSEKVFYDRNYEAELARRDLDVYLGNIYGNQCDLVVPFFSTDYNQKKWCQLEWRHIRDILLNTNNDNLLMPFRFDETPIDGFLSIDGYISIGNRPPYEIAKLILQRLGL
jgi:TIR domain